ncbi:MAG TPA: hypothetical protein V6C81_13785 [Planktothrix sp.]|jgi:hypothetical protein
MSKEGVDSSKCVISDQSAAEPIPPSVSVESDEYDRPVIQGTYTGQTFPDMDVLMPGRQVETEESEGESDGGEATEQQAEEDKTKKRAQTWIALVVIFFSWMSTACIWYSCVAQWKPKSESTARSKQTFDLPKTGLDTIYAAGGGIAANDQQSLTSSPGLARLARTGSGQPVSEQQALSAVSTLIAREDIVGSKPYLDALRAVSSVTGATTLSAEADVLAQRRRTSLAELLYRRALGIFAVSCGPLSPEYHQTLLKLACMYHETKSLTKEQNIKDFLRRQTQSEPMAQELH